MTGETHQDNRSHDGHVKEFEHERDKAEIEAIYLNHIHDIFGCSFEELRDIDHAIRNVGPDETYFLFHTEYTKTKEELEKEKGALRGATPEPKSEEEMEKIYYEMQQKITDDMRIDITMQRVSILFEDNKISFEQRRELYNQALEKIETAALELVMREAKWRLDKLREARHKKAIGE